MNGCWVLSEKQSIGIIRALRARLARQITPHPMSSRIFLSTAVNVPRAPFKCSGASVEYFSRVAFAGAAFGLATLFSASAQGPQISQANQAAIRQLDALKTRDQLQELQFPRPPEQQVVPQLYPGESEDLGSQMLLRQKPVKNYFEASADTQFSYTSNALLDSSGAKDTGISATTLSLAFAPDAVDLGAGKLSLRAGYRHLFWIYDLKKESGSLNSGNFQFGTVFLSGRYSFLEHWSASLGLDYNRVLTGASGWKASRTFEAHNWKEVLTEYSPSWGLDRSFVLTPKISGSIGYSGAYHFTDTDPLPTRTANDRLDNALMLSLVYMPSEHWMIQPYGRVSYSMYTRSGEVDTTGEHRRDLIQSLGVNVMWIPTQRISVRASISGECRNSNDPLTTDYNKMEAATGVSFTVRF